MRIILILSLLLISLVGQSQTVVVNYIERKIISKEKLETIPEFARNQALASYAYVLEYQNGISLYKNSSKTNNIEKSEKSVSEEVTEGDATHKKEASYRVTNNLIEKFYYKDINNNELLFNFKNFNKDFFGKDNLLNWDWQITTETKEINGFVCKKATSEAFGYYFTAWFTEDIAINAGPDKFDGLPGLILYVGTPYYEYVATTVEIEKKPVTITRPEVPKETVTMVEVESYAKAEISKLKSSTRTTVNGNTTTTRTTTIVH